MDRVRAYPSTVSIVSVWRMAVGILMIYGASQGYQRRGLRLALRPDRRIYAGSVIGLMAAAAGIVVTFFIKDYRLQPNCHSALARRARHLVRAKPDAVMALNVGDQPSGLHTRPMADDMRTHGDQASPSSRRRRTLL